MISFRTETRKGRGDMQYLIRILCTLAIVAMAIILSVVAGSIGLCDSCGLIVASGAVVLWALVLRLAMPYSLYWLRVLAPLVAIVILGLIIVGLIYWGQ